jgi:ATP-dependent DNA ligase
LFNHACKLGLEGILAKRRDRPYKSGRSPEGIKIKNPDAPAATRLVEGWVLRVA